MYYDEKIINGILHYRSSPKDEWVEISKEKLTDIIETLRNVLSAV